MYGTYNYRKYYNIIIGFILDFISNENAINFTFIFLFFLYILFYKRKRKREREKYDL
jgi:hypothetical protein